jgi:hypothetical protein
MTKRRCPHNPESICYTTTKVAKLIHIFKEKFGSL